MTPDLTLEIPGIPKSPNITRTRCFHVNAAQANDWKNATIAAVGDTGPEVPLPSVRLVLVALTRTRGRRDPDHVACRERAQRAGIEWPLADEATTQPASPANAGRRSSL